jgi:hypothetical protein
VADPGRAQVERMERFDQVLEGVLRETVLVGPCYVPEDACKRLWIGLLDTVEDVLEDNADVLVGFPKVPPVATFRQLETVVTRVDCPVARPDCLGEPLPSRARQSTGQSAGPTPRGAGAGRRPPPPSSRRDA